MLRVDVPATAGYSAFTQFYGEAAIYCVTFTSQEVAVRTAEEIKVNPISVYVPDLVMKKEYDQLQEKYIELREKLANRRTLPEPEKKDD